MTEQDSSRERSSGYDEFDVVHAVREAVRDRTGVRPVLDEGNVLEVTAAARALLAALDVDATGATS